MDYILMNKDAPYALFSCEQDEFGEERGRSAGMVY